MAEDQADPVADVKPVGAPEMPSLSCSSEAATRSSHAAVGIYALAPAQDRPRDSVADSLAHPYLPS
jgi:hypothetical protein